MSSLCLPRPLSLSPSHPNESCRFLLTSGCETFKLPSCQSCSVRSGGSVCTRRWLCDPERPPGTCETPHWRRAGERGRREQRGPPAKQSQAQDCLCHAIKMQTRWPVKMRHSVRSVHGGTFTACERRSVPPAECKVHVQTRQSPPLSHIKLHRQETHSVHSKSGLRRHLRVMQALFPWSGTS